MAKRKKNQEAAKAAEQDPKSTAARQAGKKSQTRSKAKSGESASLGEKVGQLKEFFEESKVEIKKVTWPSRKETITTCVAVLILTVVMAAYLGVVDVILSKVIEAILSR
jgi:preprotein translocase subunit SecE